MVRCASCSAEWFQAPPAAAAPEAAPEPAPVAPPVAAPVVEEPAPQPQIEPEIAAAPEPAAAPDPEPVVPMPQEAPASETSMAAFSALREGLKDPEPVPQDPPFQVEERADAERIHFDDAPGVVDGDVVIEERPADERQAEAARLAASLRETEAESASGGGGAFLAGFATVTLLSLVAIAAYVKAPDIAEVLPAAAGPLAGYADAVDQGRLAIAAFIRG